MTTMASQITSLAVVYSTVYSDTDQRKHQSSASLTFVWGIHRDRWIHRTKGQLRGKCFHLMTSSCVIMIYGVVCVQLAHFGLGDWEDISTAHFIIIIKSEVSALPIGIIFSVVVCLRCLLHHILSLIACTFWEKRDFVFISASSQIRFGLQIVFYCLYITPSHYHHCANLLKL